MTSVRRKAILLALAAGCLSGVSAVRADHQPTYVVGGKHGVPVIINGVDARGAVIEGDWGLYRPGHGQQIVRGRPVPVAPLIMRSNYYPSTGKKPRVGRQEIDPPAQRVQRPAKSYRRSWSTQPDPGPVTVYPPYDPPPVIIAPRVGR